MTEQSPGEDRQIDVGIQPITHEQHHRALIELRDAEAEVTRLRAENEWLRAQVAGDRFAAERARVEAALAAAGEPDEENE